MITFENYTAEIENFILNSIQRFSSENNDPNSLGIYCCPWGGWLTTNFNVNKSLAETENNCPDFEFVAFDSIEFVEWQNEYASDVPFYKVYDTLMEFNHDLGDERLNEIAFGFLVPIVSNLKGKIKQDILLQLLDSNCYKVFKS